MELCKISGKVAIVLCGKDKASQFSDYLLFSEASVGFKCLEVPGNYHDFLAFVSELRNGKEALRCVQCPDSCNFLNKGSPIRQVERDQVEVVVRCSVCD